MTNTTQAVTDAEVNEAVIAFDANAPFRHIGMRAALEGFAQARAQDAATAAVGAGQYGKGPTRPASQWGPTDKQRWPDAYADACAVEATSAAGHPLIEKGHVCGVTCHRGDGNCNGYCNGEKDAPAKYFSYATPAAGAGGSVGAQDSIYVVARECHTCSHVGINDDHDGHAACNTCDWSGPSPQEDLCPQCGSEGTMSAACPKCSNYYNLIAETYITPAPEANPENLGSGATCGDKS